MHPHLDHSLALQARDSFRVLFIGKKPVFFFFALADKGADETFQHRLSSERLVSGFLLLRLEEGTSPPRARALGA